jgi:hypothetical protein
VDLKPAVRYAYPHRVEAKSHEKKAIELLSSVRERETKLKQIDKVGVQLIDSQRVKNAEGGI